METVRKSNFNGTLLFAPLPAGVSKPASEKQNTRQAHKKCRPFGNIDHRTIIVHNKGTHYTVQLNTEVSATAYIKNYKSAYIAKGNHGDMYLVLSTEMPDKKDNRAKISFNTHISNVSSSFSNKYLVNSICKHFCLGRGDFSLKIEESPGFTTQKNQEVMVFKLSRNEQTEPTKVCQNCGRELPMSMFVSGGKGKGKKKICKECYREYRRNLTSEAESKNTQPKPDLSQFADKELYEELKRRGWSGKLTKSDTLE